MGEKSVRRKFSGWSSWMSRKISSLRTLGQVISETLCKEYPFWILWAPVGVGLGVFVYFSFPFEPSFPEELSVSLPLLAIAIGLFWYAAPSRQKLALPWRWAAWGILLMNAGFWAGVVRTRTIENKPLVTQLAPMRIEGIVESIEYPATKHRLIQRVTLSHVTKKDKFAKEDLPSRIVLTIQIGDIALLEGQRIGVCAVLGPPGKTPALSGGYDSRFVAFFQGIGGRGFALTKPEILEDPTPSLHTAFSQLRSSLARNMHTHLPAPLGALACALVTGDKTAVSDDVRNAFARSGLSHILAISGLHLSLVASLCFFLFRFCLSFFPKLLLYVNLNKMASLLSLAVSWLYVQISGKGYPVLRSFIMMACVILATFLMRRTSTLRTLAFAAMFLLLKEPEALFSISFQLSFAAVVGLGVFYERYKKSMARSRAGKFVQPVWDLLLSTGASSITTFPLLVFTFHQISFQAFLSNLLAIPLTGSIIVPLGGCALLSLLWGGSDVLFWLWGMSLKMLIQIAMWCSTHLSFMVFAVAPCSVLFLYLMILGGIWMAAWKQRWRFLGVVPLAIGCCGAFTGTFPYFVVSPENHLVAYVDRPNKTLWVSSRRKGRFIMRCWAQNFGLDTIRPFPAQMTRFSLPDGRKILFTERVEGPLPAHDLLLTWSTLPSSDGVLSLGALPDHQNHLVFCDSLWRVKSPPLFKRPWSGAPVGDAE